MIQYLEITAQNNFKLILLKDNFERKSTSRYFISLFTPYYCLRSVGRAYEKTNSGSLPLISKEGRVVSRYYYVIEGTKGVGNTYERYGCEM